jgi:hypothetical protein
MENETSELQNPMWAIVTHDKVLLSSVTYDTARTYIKGLDGKYGNEPTIVTNDAAFRLAASQKQKEDAAAI